MLDEVTRAFSPWIQKMYLLRARGPSADADDPDMTEVQEHLAPLFFLLHRKIVVETIDSAAATLGKAFTNGTVDAVIAERALVVFPIMLETISLLDRLSPETHAQLLKVTSASVKLQSCFDDQSSHRRRRLQLIVSSIRSVVERPDVKAALLDPSKFARREVRLPPRIPVHARHYDDAASSTPSSPAGSTVGKTETLMVPPIGVEDEDMGTVDNEEGFMSASEGSDTERSPPHAKKKNSSSVTPKDKARRVTVQIRSEAYPRGHKTHSWDIGKCSNWPIRSETYFRDKRKLPCDAPMLDLLHVDWVMLANPGRTPSVSQHADFYPAFARSAGDSRFLFIVNSAIGPYQIVMTMALNPDAAWLQNPESPQARVWKRFLEADDAGRRERLKLILTMDEGPWLVKQVFVKKPVLICKLLKANFHYKPGDYLEVAFEPKSGKTVSMVLKSLKRIVFGLAVLIEAKEEEELPESLLATAVSRCVDPTRLCLPA